MPVQPGPNTDSGTGTNPDGWPAPPEDDDSPRGESMTDPRTDARSTFALDVDTGSYTRFRDALAQGHGVPRDEVRTEEFVNYFRQDYETPSDGLDVSIDAAVLPFRPSHRIVRVGIASAEVSDEDRRDADLVLVVDCSGSMRQAGKMETTKAALRTLVGSLRRTDRVAIVCYSSRARVALDPTPVAERESVLAAIDELEPQSSTNAAEGLALGYDLAGEMRGDDDRMTRVVLVSDGVANVGETDAGGILERMSSRARDGISLISVGVGITTYDDELLEQLADRGDGWHVYVDGQEEAERVFATGLTSSLVVAGRDAKAQVEFDPGQVAGYRLIGYENRMVSDRDFRNDAVDGGEVFAGRTTTALYEVEMRRGAGRDAFVRATVRYLDEDGEPVERRRHLADVECAAELEETSPRLRQDVVIAMLTDHLVGGPWSQWVGPDVLREEAEALPELLDGDPDVAQLVELVQRATA
ncbi:von Willebrand factor type A domain-containing protein [Oryzobacter terrae]|uniref:vWA domain-containing protein n=1 Tax=Oryzobacter terrae TaxID=1620385 RepID=UPI00366F2330